MYLTEDQEAEARRGLSLQAEHLSAYAAHLETEMKAMPEGFLKTRFEARAESAREMASVLFRAATWSSRKGSYRSDV